MAKGKNYSFLFHVQLLLYNLVAHALSDTLLSFPSKALTLCVKNVMDIAQKKELDDQV